MHIFFQNHAIMPIHNDEPDKPAHIDQGGIPRRRGGRRNVPGLLDEIAARISMLTDPPWTPDAMNSSSGPSGDDPPARGGPPVSRKGLMPRSRFADPGQHVLRWLLRCGGAPDGGGHRTDIIPIRFRTARRLPPALRSRFLPLSSAIASGYFGWDEIIHALPEMKEDPCAIEIKYGQGRSPATAP